MGPFLGLGFIMSEMARWTSMAWRPLSRLGFPVTPSQLLRSKMLLHA